MVAGERTTSFLQYAKERAQEILNAGGLSNWKKYNGFINKLEEFLTGVNGRTRDLSFGELPPGLLSKFETYLHSLTNQRAPERKLHPNTVAVNLTIFKTLVNRASQIEKSTGKYFTLEDILLHLHIRFKLHISLIIMQHCEISA